MMYISNHEVGWRTSGAKENQFDYHTKSTYLRIGAMRTGNGKEKRHTIGHVQEESLREMMHAIFG